MKITLKLISKLEALVRGETVPSSMLKGEWVDDLLREGALQPVIRGSRQSYRATRPDLLPRYLMRYDEMLGNLAMARRLLGGADRSDQAREGGNSKLVRHATCPGFLVNTYHPILCHLRGKEITVAPDYGAGFFVFDWETFSIPADALVIGIENMENFREIRRQRRLFESRLRDGEHHIIFVARYPQSQSLRRWLEGICNRYEHFGDFDLEGVRIYQTEFRQFLGARASMLIPDNIEQLIAAGTRRRYDDQYLHTKNIQSDEPEVNRLIELIHRYRRCYDQEGLIEE